LTHRTAVRAASLALALLTAAGASTVRADGADVPLQEAARRAGIQVGVLGELLGAAENALLEREFEVLVAHGFSWNVIHPAPGVWNFTYADLIVDFAAARGKPVIGMHLVWEQVLLDDAAPWVLAIEDPDALRATLRDHLRTIHARYEGRLDALTVVNEPLETFGGALHQNHFHRVLGADYVAQVFRIAREEAPGVTLVLNENFTEYFPDKASGLVALVAELVRGAVPIDAVGLQTHLLFGEPDWELLRRTMKALGDLGVRVFVTELDAPVAVDLADRLAVQADRTERAVQTCLLVPACERIVWWGLHDGITWLDSFLSPGLSPLLFDESLAAKPSYFAARDALLGHAPRDLSGSLLRVEDASLSPARRRLRLSSRAAGVTTGGGDPRRLGATLRLRNPSTGEESVLELPPGGWRQLAASAGEPGFAYRGAPGDPCQGVRLRPGRGLDVNCRGAGLGFTLDEPSQGALEVELRLDGAPRLCFRFGGVVAHDRGNTGARGGRFVARAAPAGTACADATAAP
jgi:endo-1,4-beta-xylanase